MTSKWSRVIRALLIAMAACLCVAILRDWSWNLIEYISWDHLPRFAMLGASLIAMSTLLARDYFWRREMIHVLVMAVGVEILEVFTQLAACLLASKYCDEWGRGPVSVISATVGFWGLAHVVVTVVSPSRTSEFTAE